MPRYSPEYNPIEMMWSKDKAHVRKKNHMIFCQYGEKQVSPNWMLRLKMLMDGTKKQAIIIKTLL